MRPELEKKLEKIQRFSRTLRRICRAMFVVMSLLLVICIVAVLIGGGTITVFDISLPMRSFAFHQRILLAPILLFLFAVPLKGLYHLQRLFAGYARGEIFTIESVGQIRQFGVAILLWPVANLVWIAVALALAHRHFPHSFYFRADSIAIGIAVIVISWIMEMAAEIRQENELTI